jgi:hypothetical protein
LGRVSDSADFVFEVGFWRLIGHIDTAPRNVELPAVVDAAQAVLLVSSEEERRTSMRAIVRRNANVANRISKGNKVLAQ